MSASIRTLSQLPKISSEQLNKNALFEVSQPVEIEISSSNDKIIKYASKSITKDDLSKKIILCRFYILSYILSACNCKHFCTYV